MPGVNDVDAPAEARNVYAGEMITIGEKAAALQYSPEGAISSSEIREF